MFLNLPDAMAWVARLLLLLALIGAASATAAAGPIQWTFDTDPIDQPPAGATVFSGQWLVRAEADAPSPPNALCQTGVAEFPALSLTDAAYTDFVAPVQFKPVSGDMDRAAGIIFRIQDKDNYYILRANALEGNVNLYKYVNGQRTDIKGGSATVESGKWQELRVEVKGDELRGFLNGDPVVDATDATFKQGGIGLWTKSDSVTCFDSVSLTVH